METQKDPLTETLGWLATIVGVCIMVPQVVKAITTKSMQDVALGTIIVYVVNCVLWTFYGKRIKAKQVIAANCIGGVIGIIELILKLNPWLLSRL